MDPTLLAGMIAFCAAAAFTPGPNNLIALQSGTVHGFGKTIPHVFGVAFGFGVMIALVGLGLGQAFAVWPVLYSILKVGAAAYILFLAWKLLKARAPGEGSAAPPMTFLGSAGFQWINPKAWFATLTVLSAYADPRAYAASMVIAGGVNVLLAIGAVSTWALFGTVVRRWLGSPRRLRWFNLTMAVLLVASIVPSLMHQ